MNTPLRVFLSYSSHDRDLLERLRAHLSPLERRGLIESWYDRDIGAGRDFDQEIRARLEQADLILFLLSADFVDSDYIVEVEVQRALERHRAGEARVVPIYLRPVHLKGTPFVDLNGLPDPKRPVTSGEWQDEDEALAAVAAGIEQAIAAQWPARAAPWRQMLPPPRHRPLAAALALLVLTAAGGLYGWPRHLFDQGQTAYEKEDWQGARAAFTRAAALPFAPAAADWTLGLLAERANDTAAALDHYARAVAADDDPRFALSHAALLERLGRYPEAIDLLRPLLERHDRLLAGYPHLVAALRLGGTAETADYYQHEAGERAAQPGNWALAVNAAPWYFPTTLGTVELRGPAAKHAWLLADHALTLFLLGREDEAATRLAKARELLADKSAIFDSNIKALLGHQLGRLARTQPRWLGRLEAFQRRFQVEPFPAGDAQSSHSSA